MDREKEAKKIITNLFNSGKLKIEVEKICARNKIKKETYISEDIISETFYHLSNTNPDTLINIHRQGERNLLGYAVTIAIRKGVNKNPAYPQYHKHSVATNILFASNLNNHETICDNDEIEDEKHGVFNHVLFENPLQENSEKELWKLIRGNLSKAENALLNSILFNKRKRGRCKDKVKVKKDKLFEKIKSIVEENKIKIV